MNGQAPWFAGSSCTQRTSSRPGYDVERLGGASGTGSG